MYSSAVKPLISLFQHTAARRRLEAVQVLFEAAARFNTQPPEGGWVKAAYDKAVAAVSTHSRPKAAGQFCGQSRLLLPVSTHSRPKAAGIKCCFLAIESKVSTHSRPKAAGPRQNPLQPCYWVSTHSRPKAAG